MNIEYTLIRDLRPYPRNARTHSRKQIAQIAKSIKRFGFNNPVLIDDHNQIIAGHGRVEAASLNGMDAVPTVRLSHLSEADKRAYIIADNKHAENAGWDREILAIELQFLTETGIDVEPIGFEPAEVDLILEEANDGDNDNPENATPAYANGPTVSQPGDIWMLGNHILACGDARDDATYALLMRGGKADFVFTDPPYNVPIDGHVCGLGRIRHQDFAMGCGEMSQDQFTAFLANVYELLCRYSVDGSIHQVCMDWRHMREMLDAGYPVLQHDQQHGAVDAQRAAVVCPVRARGDRGARARQDCSLQG
jgi:hypothetical protein